MQRIFGADSTAQTSDQTSRLTGTLTPTKARVVLLTGATGFVGKRLLKELLAQGNCTVVCPVRASSELDAQRRGRVITSDLRAVFLRADLESPRLGLSEETWERLAGRLQEIYHCAASVSFDQSLAEARLINVEGTRRLLELARSSQARGTFRRFHHISTAYVAGHKSGPVDASFLPPDNARAFRNSYERSKAEAERLLRAQTEVAVSIYRPSIVCGDTTSGATDNFNVLYGPMRQIARGSLPRVLKSGDARLDCVGVDYVVRGIVALRDAAKSRVDSFHLTAGATFAINDLVRVAVQEAKSYEPDTTAACEVISSTAWRALGISARLAAALPTPFKNTRRWGKIVSRGFRNFQPYAPYCGVNTIFVCAREARLLAAHNLIQPPPLQYLQTITRYAIESRFGNAVANNAVANNAVANNELPNTSELGTKSTTNHQQMVAV